MIPATFAYARPESADAAIGVLAQYGEEAKLLAGGHSLLPLMKLRLATPSVLVDVGRLTELSYVRELGDEIAVGGLTGHHDLEHSELLQKEAPVLSVTASHVGDPQVRHRGTLGGSLARGDPASDLAAALLALRGRVVVRGANGERTIAAVAAVGGDDPGVALVNMGSTPIRATGVEEAVRAHASPADAAASAPEGTDPAADLNGSVEYRRHLAQVLVRRALTTIGGA